VRGKAVRRNDVIDQSLNVGKPEAPLDAQLAGIGLVNSFFRQLPNDRFRESHCARPMTLVGLFR
jgi:hypothetical protein